MSAHHYLAANLNHIVADALGAQRLCNHVASESLGDGAAVKHDSRIILGNQAVLLMDLTVSGNLQQAVNCGLTYVFGMLESESPCIHGRSHRNIERPMGQVRYLHGAAVYLEEHGIGHLNTLAAVYGRYGGLPVEHGQSAVHKRHGVFKLGFEISVIEIGDVIARAEHQALGGAVLGFGGLALRQDYYGAYYQKRQERVVPLFHITL